MNKETLSALNDALTNAQMSSGPMEAYQLLEDAVVDALGYCGSFRVATDPDPQDPRDGVNLSTLALRFSNSQIGDHNARPLTDFSDDEILYKRRIFGYDHSGLVLSPNEFNCKFDSGPAGWQYVTHAMAQAWGTSDLEEVVKVFDAELKDYNRYLSSSGYWVINVIGDPDTYQVEADTFQELLEGFDHDALRGSEPIIARKCLEQAWEERDTKDAF